MSCGRKKLAEKKWNWHLRNVKLYNAWLNMRRRCRTREEYKHVSVCDEWVDYWQFHCWAMDNGFEEHLTIDRIDPYGDYCPENCRWVSHTSQQRNRTNNRVVSAWGETKTVAEWLEDLRCAAKEKTLYSRLKRGWSAEDAITRPPMNAGGRARLVHDKRV